MCHCVPPIHVFPVSWPAILPLVLPPYLRDAERYEVDALEHQVLLQYEVLYEYLRIGMSYNRRSTILVLYS